MCVLIKGVNAFKESYINLSPDYGLGENLSFCTLCRYVEENFLHCKLNWRLSWREYGSRKEHN